MASPAVFAVMATSLTIFSKSRIVLDKNPSMFPIIFGVHASQDWAHKDTDGFECTLHNLFLSLRRSSLSDCGWVAPVLVCALQDGLRCLTGYDQTLRPSAFMCEAVWPCYLTCSCFCLFFSVNYRGSLGYGQDSVLSLPGNVGTQDVRDVQVSPDWSMLKWQSATSHVNH